MLKRRPEQATSASLFKFSLLALMIAAASEPFENKGTSPLASPATATSSPAAPGHDRPADAVDEVTPANAKITLATNNDFL